MKWNYESQITWSENNNSQKRSLITKTIKKLIKGFMNHRKRDNKKYGSIRIVCKWGNME